MALRNLLSLSSLLLLAIGTLGACAVDEEACPAVSGEYVPTYQPLTGNCGGAIMPLMLPFGENSGSGSGSIQTTQNRLNDDVVTEVVRKGCTVRVSQTVATKQGIVQSKLDAESLQVHNARELSGQVSYVMYNELNQVACQGTYNAVVRKPMAVGIDY